MGLFDHGVHLIPEVSNFIVPIEMNDFKLYKIWEQTHLDFHLLDGLEHEFYFSIYWE
jgi:hypothetical protein